MVFPEPVISMAVEPKTKADQEKMGDALQPPGRGRPDVQRPHRRGDRPDHHRRHGRVAPGNHRRPHEARIQVEANVGKPQVAYRETIRKTVDEVEGKFIRQSGGRGQYGHVVAEVEPQPPGEGLRVRRRDQGRFVSARIHSRGPKGRRGDPGRRVLAGYPIVDFKVTLFFGSFHEVDSNEIAFKMAGSLAFKEGCAGPVRFCWSR